MSDDTRKQSTAYDVERALVASWRRYAVALGGRASERDGVLVAITGVPDPSFNPAFVSGPVADPAATVRWAVAERAGTGSGFDLPAGRHRAVERALAGLGHQVLLSRPAMAAAVADVAPPGGVAAEVRPVVTAEDVEAYAMVQAAGFGMDPGIARRSISAAGTHLVVWRDGVPVAAAAATVGGDGTVGVFGVTTVPAERGKGYGTLATAAAVDAGRRAGASLAWLQASDDGLPVYRRMGFREGDDWMVWVGAGG